MSKYALYNDIPEFAAEFLYYCKTIKDMSAKTVEQYYLDLRIFFRFLKSNKGATEPFNKINASDITLDDIKKINLSDLYVFLNFAHEERENQARARNRKISCLRSFFKFLAKHNMITENPTEYIGPAKTPSTLPIHLSIEECEALLNSVDGPNKERNYAIITLFLNCGLRLSELVGIDITDITENVLRVMGKRHKEREVYLNESCISALKDYLAVRDEKYKPPKDLYALFVTNRQKRISNRMVQTIIEKQIEKAHLGGKHYSTHKLRHTTATLLYQHGTDIRTVQEILGHKNLSTTQIYTHVKGDTIKDVMINYPPSNITHKNETDEKTKKS